MVIVLADPPAKESSELVQERRLKPPTDQTSLVQPPGGQDIHVIVDEEYLPIFGGKIKKHYDDKTRERQQDGKIHIFEIGDCLRKALIMKTYPDFAVNTIYDYTNFMQGLNSESAIVDILKSQMPSGTESSFQKDIDFSDISAHPDFIEGDVVFELKSTNKIKPLILSDDNVKGYLRQVVYYMILMDIEKGRIMVRYNLPYFPEFVTKDTVVDETRNFTGDGESMYKLRFHKDTGQFPFFPIRINIPLDAPIRDYVKKGLLEVVKPLYNEGDISKIPRLDGMMDGSNWKCSNYCKVRELCYEIEDTQSDPETRSILLNKHIDDSMNKKRRSGRRKDRDVILS